MLNGWSLEYIRNGFEVPSKEPSGFNKKTRVNATGLIDSIKTNPPLPDTTAKLKMVPR